MQLDREQLNLGLHNLLWIVDVEFVQLLQTFFQIWTTD